MDSGLFFQNKYRDQVSRALSFLEGKLDSGISSNYSLCLVAYALSLANYSSAHTALTELLDRATIQGTDQIYVEIRPALQMMSYQT